MADQQALRARAEELAAREWDAEAIEKRVRGLAENGIPRKKLDPNDLRRRREEVLDRVQRRAEENNFTVKNCAQATALALFEEFGLGGMETIKALSPFPGIGGTGEICGGITGSLMAFGLLFGSDDRLDREAIGRTIRVAQRFMDRFEREIGHRHCADIIETVTIGHRLNPGESPEAMMTFAAEKGFEKCSLIPGIGARLAAEVIIDELE